MMMDNSQQNNAHRTADEHLEASFRQMQPKEPAPEQLKREVFSTLDSIQLVADVLDVFTIKFMKTEVDFIDGHLEEGEAED